MESSTPVIVAHRGLHDVYPENSLTSFRAAWEGGFHWCECDVHVTADHRTIVIHDETLDRTTTGAGLVKHKVWENLNRHRLRDAHGRMGDEPIPLLSDVLTMMPMHCGLLIELKPPMPLFHHMARAYIQRNLRCMFQSFDAGNVQSLCDNGLASHTALLIDDLTQLTSLHDTGCHGAHLRYDLLNAEVIHYARQTVKWIGCWTARSQAQIEHAGRLGVDLVITDTSDLPILKR